MKGDIYQDKENKSLWIEIYFDGDDYSTLEGTSDVSEDFGLPKGTLYESGDAEFISLYNIDLSGYKKVNQNKDYCLKVPSFYGTHYDYVYGNLRQVKSLVLEKLRKAKTFEDYQKLFKKYAPLFYMIKE